MTGPRASGTRVAVIGAGVVGANIAHRLAARGVDVTVVDGSDPANGTSASSISWLSTFPQIANATPDMVAYRNASHADFSRLEAELEPGWMHWTGTLTWGEGRAAARLARDFVTMTDIGADLRVLRDQELASLDPAVRIVDGGAIYLETGGGWVDAPRLVAALLRRAEENGATIHTRAPVTALRRTGGAWEVTAGGRVLVVDVVVNAAGSWASHVGRLAGTPVPLDLRPGLLVYSVPLETPVRSVLNGPATNIRPDPSGGVAIHWRGEDTYTGHGYNSPDPVAVLDHAADVLPELRGTAPARVDVGIRPVPPGGPIIGWHPSAPGMFIAVSHGGVGWGPRWATIAARAIVDGQIDARADVFSPERFFRTPRRATESPSESTHSLGAVPAQM